MIGDEELDAILATLGGELDDAELDRRTAGFRDALRRLRGDPAEATRIDALVRVGAPVTGMRDDPSVIALVSRAAGSDQSAWNDIVDRYAPLVWSICTRFQLSSQDAEDVGQTVWLLLVEHLGKLREPAALPGWLAKTTRHECLRVVTAARKSERLGARLDDAMQFADDAVLEEEVLTAERNANLRAALAGLPLRCQQLLALLLCDPPCSYAEISARLDIPIGSIGPQRGRCLARLRRSPAFLTEGCEESSPTSGATGQVHENPSVA